MDNDSAEEIMMNWLITAITLFPKCKKDLNSFDRTTQEFADDLSNTEIEILATWMKYSYLDKQVYKESLLKQSLSSKDYAMYSQANHLDKLITLKELTYREATKKVTDYMYNNANYGDLG